MSKYFKKPYREALTDTKIHKREMGQRAGKDNTKTGTELKVVRIKDGTGEKMLVTSFTNIPGKPFD